MFPIIRGEMDSQLKRAFSQALRVEVLERIATTPASPRQIAETTGEPLGRVAYHTSILRRTGCIHPIDPDSPESIDCVYRVAALLPPSPRIPLSDSTRGQVLASVLRRIVIQGYAALKAGAFGTNPDHAASCESMRLDDRGVQETRAILEEAAERIAAAKAAAARRLAQSGDAGTPTTVAMAAFEAMPDDERTAA
jgi:hypothetical protein